MLKSILYTCLMIAVLLSGTAALAQTAIGGTSPNPSAMLDVQSDDKGMLIPRMTTEKRDLIGAPANGLIIFNTTENRLQINQGGPGTGNASWQSFFILGSANIEPCSNVIITPATVNQDYNFLLLLQYTNGNGGLYFGQNVNSTGATGLQAIMDPGSFVPGSGTILIDIIGKPTSVGDGFAGLRLFINGQECTLIVPIQQP